jgi:hypothetical protein
MVTVGAIACPHDAAPCHVWDAIGPCLVRPSGGAPPEDAPLVAAVRAVVPCHLCWRPTWAAAQALRGVRLGQHERHILLTASGQGGGYVAPRGTSPAAIEAHRRALRRLEAAGLVELRWQCVRGVHETVVPAHSFHAAGERFDMEEYVQRQSWRSRRRAVQLTPLGQAVVHACREPLQSGARLRWPRLLPAIGAALQACAPLLTLLRETEACADRRDIARLMHRDADPASAFYGPIASAVRRACDSGTKP